jgi:signal transduction histidine kinase
MSTPLRILGIAAQPDQLAWLWSKMASLGGAGDELARVVRPDGLPDELTDYDAVILDDSIGLESALSITMEVIQQTTPIPVLIVIESADIAHWERLLRTGAQDLIFKDTDSPAEIRRRISRSMSQANVLQATQEAEVRLRTIIENIDDGVLILDLQNAIMFANPATEFLIDRPLDELFGLKVPFEVPDGGEDTVTIRHASGVDRTLHLKIYPVIWEGLEAHLITLHDVTEEQETRNQLRLARKSAEEAASMKSTFLANMSHELRMPLASIIGFAQLIGEGTEEPDFKEFAEAIEFSGNRLLTTINAVLEATRLEKHHIDPLLQSVKVDAVVEEVVASLQPLIQTDSVKLKCHGEGSPAAKADEDFLVRILNNLIGNAAKFTSEGSITVTWKEEDGFVHIDVKDTGIGISPEFLPELFNEFTQESTGAGRTHEGTGLGLTIVKGLVDLLEGRIEVKSTLGEGSCFSVYIPLADVA